MNIDWKAIDKAWDKGNAAGHGWGVGEETDTPMQAIQRNCTFIAERNGCFIGQSNAGSYFAVYDANGPWAVDISAELLGEVEGA